MSLSRRAAKRDTAELEIIDTFRKCGWSVQSLSAKDAPDLLIGKHGLNLLCEVKTGKKKLQAGQMKWHAAWKGSPPYVIRNSDEALALNKAASSLGKL